MTWLYQTRRRRSGLRATWREVAYLVPVLVVALTSAAIVAGVVYIVWELVG